MAQVNISNIDINFPRYSYTIEEIVDDFLGKKLDAEVKNFCKQELGIERIYKAYDLSKISNNDTDYVEPNIQLNEMYVSITRGILNSTRRQPQDIGFLITINDNQQYLDPAPAVEVLSRIGLNKDIRTQNFQGMACSSFSEALRNAAGHFALGYEGEVLVLIGSFYTNWFLDRIKQTKLISIKNRKDFNNFIYFLVFSDVTGAAILSHPEKSNRYLAKIKTETISSRKDNTVNGHKKAIVKLSRDKSFRIIFDLDVNSKILRESVGRLSLENISYIKQKFPVDFKKVKFWGLHSAGNIFVEYVRKACSIDKMMCKLTYDVMKETGNTGAASSLQLIKESIQRKVLKSNETGGIIDYGWEGADAFLYEVY